MMTKIEIDNDTVDSLVRDALGWHLRLVRADIAAAKKKRILREHQQQELATNIILANALAEVYDYFGGNVK